MSTGVERYWATRAELAAVLHELARIGPGAPLERAARYVALSNERDRLHKVLLSAMWMPDTLCPDKCSPLHKPG